MTHAKQSWKVLFLTVVLFCVPFLTGCDDLTADDRALKQNVRVYLMDWHIAGLWVINCPVAWVRVENYNDEPIHEVTLEYVTYDIHGKPLDQGTFVIEGTIGPHTSKNFIELYLGLVDLYSERLTVKLLSVRKA